MLRGLPKQFWLLWTGTLVNRLGGFVLLYLALYLTTGRGLSAAYAGVVVGLYSGGGAIGVIVGGVLADRWGRRPTLLAAMAASVALMVTLSQTRHPVAIAICAAALGLATEAVRPAFGAMIIDVVPPADRIRAFTLNYWAINLGFAGAALLGGLAARVDFQLLFLVDAATTAVFGLVVALFVVESRPVASGPIVSGPPATGRRVRGGPGLHTVLGDRVFLGFVGCTLLTAVVFAQPAFALPLAMAADGLSPTAYGAVMAVNGLLIVTGQLFIPRLIGDSRPSRVLALAALVTGVGFGATALASTAPVFAATVVVWTLGEMLNAPANAALLADLSPTALRGRYQGMFSLAWQVAGFAAPVISGVVAQRSGDTPLWIGCLVLCVLVAAAHLALEPGRARRIETLRIAEAGVQEPATRTA